MNSCKAIFCRQRIKVSERSIWLATCISSPTTRKSKIRTEGNGSLYQRGKLPQNTGLAEVLSAVTGALEEYREMVKKHLSLNFQMAAICQRLRGNLRHDGSYPSKWNEKHFSHFQKRTQIFYRKPGRVMKDRLPGSR